MHTISLHDILPRIFSDNPPPSDVWRQRVEFVAGQSYLLQADSGKGKSSLFAYIYGYRDDFEGEILFDGRRMPLVGSPEWDTIRQCRIGILFQDLKIFPELTALENIELKNRLQAYKSEAEIDDMLRRLEISDKSHQPCGKLSWGQQQRVAIIRALCQPFDFLLLDEPISHIDDRMARIVAELIAEEVASRQAAVVVSSIGKELPLTYDNILNL